jgi:hypothetical protein
MMTMGMPTEAPYTRDDLREAIIAARKYEAEFDGPLPQGSRLDKVMRYFSDETILETARELDGVTE